MADFIKSSFTSVRSPVRDEPIKYIIGFRVAPSMVNLVRNGLVELLDLVLLAPGQYQQQGWPQHLGE